MVLSCPISQAPTQEVSDQSEVKNLNRDIVDTYLHASRKSGTTWPNKVVFHTHGRKQNWELFNPCSLHLFWMFSFIENCSIRVYYICFESSHFVFHPQYCVGSKLRAIQSVFTTFVLNVFIHWKLFNPCLLHLFWKFSFCFSSLDEILQYCIGSDWFSVWTRSPPYGWTLLASSWSERFPKVEVSSL
jgi:hypothetical protein